MIISPAMTILDRDVRRMYKVFLGETKILSATFMAAAQREGLTRSGRGVGFFESNGVYLVTNGDVNPDKLVERVLKRAETLRR